MVELGIEGSDEGAHERDLESWTGNGALTPEIHALIVCNQDNKNREEYLSVAVAIEVACEQPIPFGYICQG